ncbi:MAG: pyridoxal-phosphate dependent enzyme, partial [Ilumatobacteraceae bacterium]
MVISENVLDLIGNTPLVQLNRVSKGCKATVVGKLEYFNPVSNVKDRIGVSMV